MLQRKPDSGLGNIRSSPADPSRNIDWVLMTAQAALTIAGCFVVFSATRTRTADPYTYVTRQVIFAIVASLAMVVVMAVDYQWLKERARTLYLLTVAALFGLAAYGIAVPGTRPRRRHRPDPDPAGGVRQVHRPPRPVRLPERRAQRRGQLPALPRRPDDRRPAGDPDHHPARPRHGVGAHRHGDGRAAGRRRQGPLHRRHQPALAASPSAPRSSPASSTRTSWNGCACSSTRTTPSCRTRCTRSPTPCGRSARVGCSARAGWRGR